MKKYVIGIIAGVIGAGINILFLISATGIDFNVYISTGVTWLVIGLLTAACDFKMKGIVKGIFVALLVSSSSFVYTFSSSVSGGMWTVIDTAVIGAAIGFFLDKIVSHFSKHDHRPK